MEAEQPLEAKAKKEYEEYATITEEIFKELLRVHREELGKVVPIPPAENHPEAYSVEHIKRMFEEGRTKEYHRELEKHINRLWNAHQKQLNRKIAEKDGQIAAAKDQLAREIDNSRVRQAEIVELRRVLNQEDQQHEDYKQTMRKSRILKEWELARHLFEQTGNAEHRAWIRNIEAEYIRMESELAAIRAVTLAKSENNFKEFIGKLMETCKVDIEDQTAVIDSVKAIESDKLRLQAEADKARETAAEKMKELAEVESELLKRTSELAEQERQLNKETEQLAIAMSKFEDQKKATAKQLRESDIQLEELSLAKKQSDVDASKFKELEQAVLGDRRSRRQQLQTILKHFSGLQPDGDVEKLAEDWQNGLLINQNNVTLQRLIYIRLAEQKRRLVTESGLLEQYRVDKEKMESVLTETVRISIAAFNEIQELIFNKLLGIRYEPMNERLSFDLDKAVDTLAKEYHVRISRINQRISQLKRTNQRRTVEYVMKEPVRD